MLYLRTVLGTGLIAPFTAILASFALVQTTFAQADRAEQSSMDPAIDWITKARQRFQEVQDYECRVIKQERVNGRLLPEGTAIMKVRNNLLSIYIRCESPDSERGLEVCYVANRNRGKMRVPRKPFIDQAA